MSSKVNLTMDQGSTFVVEFSLEDPDGLAVDLSTFTGEAQMRKEPAANDASDFVVNLFSNGIVKLTMDWGTTANVEAGRYYYDVELTDTANVVTRPIEGIITVTPNVTR
jgi:hypothetical protein